MNRYPLPINNNNSNIVEISGIRFKFLFPNFQVYKEKLSLVDLSIQEQESELYVKFKRQYGNFIFKYDSEDEILGHWANTYELAYSIYKKEIEIFNKTMEELIQVDSEARNFDVGSKLEFPEDFDNFLQGKITSTTRSPYINLYKKIRLLTPPLATFMNAMKDTLILNKNYYETENEECI